MAGELKERKGENEPMFGCFSEGETMMFPQRSKQALPNGRHISPVTVITSVTK